MPARRGAVVGLRPVSYLCGGLAPRFLFSSYVFLLAGNMEKPTTTHQPTTRPLPACGSQDTPLRQRCVHCNRSMSPAAISDLCGWCQARGAAAGDDGGEG
jgi:hypothetical protein